MTLAQTLIEQLCDAILTIEDEAVRLQVCEGLINKTLDGDFCDDKRQLTGIQDMAKPEVMRLVNLKDLPKILALRQSVH